MAAQKNLKTRRLCDKITPESMVNKMNFEIKQVKTERFTMNYLKSGSGKRAFVIIPGMSLKSVLGSAEAVAGEFSEFTGEYTVYLFDRREDMPDKYSVYDMADDTSEAMTVAGITSADIFGASQGGMIAMVIAAKYPSLVDKAVIASSLAKPNEYVPRVFSRWKELAEKRDVPALNRDVFTKVYSDAYYSSYSDVFAVLEKEGTDEECRHFAILAEAVLGFDFYGRLNEIKCPVLVMGDRNDRVFGGEASELIAEKLGCEIYMYDGYSHAVYDEAPDFRKRVYDFLRK